MATVINVGGTSRSGSTLLHLMLGNALDAFACGEVSNLFTPIMPHHKDPLCACLESPCPVWSKIAPSKASSFYADTVANLGVEYIVDSSKQLTWQVAARGYAAKHGIGSVNLFVWKEPVDLAYSFWKRGHDMMYWRKQFTKYYSRIPETGLPELTVNFGDLEEDPARKLADVCRAIGMPYFQNKERFWESDNHHLFGSPGVRGQVAWAPSSTAGMSAYPPEFAESVEDLRKRIAEDEVVQSLISALKRADVANAPAGIGPSMQYDPVSIQKPWFYAQLTKRKLRRWNPRQLGGSLPRRAPGSSGPAPG